MGVVCGGGVGGCVGGKSAGGGLHFAGARFKIFEAFT